MSKTIKARKEKADPQRELSAALAALREVISLVGIYASAREVGQAERLEKRATALLNPEPVEPVIEEINALVSMIKSCRATRAQQAKEFAIGTAAEEARMKRLRDNLHARQAAELEARRQREQRAIHQAVDEVIAK